MENRKRGLGRGRGRGGPDDQKQMQVSQPHDYYSTHYAKALEMMERTVVLETSECHLPDLQDFFSGKPWELQDLANSRDQLNKTKNSLDSWDRRRWERAAADANPADQVRAMLRSRFQVELGTIAWAKMFETIWQCDMMPLNSPAVPRRERGSPGVVSVHLCEAPGAFIAATNHFVKTHRRGWRWDWMAVSLNPYCEANDKFAMIEDDALIAATTANWCFGADNTGDIRRVPNIRAIWERGKALCVRMGCPGGALMVTADGAVDTSFDPNRQEMITASLHYCEVVAALGLLAPGGNFVWKGFTLYEHPSICSLYLMGCVFDRVLVYKPATSKPANSEVYVVGKGFRGVPSEVLELLLAQCGEHDIFQDRSLFPLELLPQDFLATARHAAVYFGQTTSEAIGDAIELEGLPVPVKRDALRRAKEAFAEHWCTQLQVQPLQRQHYLAPDTELDGRRNNTSGKRKGGELTGTLEERQDQYRKRQKALGRDGEQDAAGGGGGGAGWDGAGLGGGGLGLGAGGGGGAGSGGGDMQMSSKALAMMAKMGHVEGQGLGRDRQGIASALDVGGNRRRAGLGLGQDGGGGSNPASAAPDWSLSPDSGVLVCPGPLAAAEVEAWPPLSGSAAPLPKQIIKSKLVHEDDVLLALRVARRELCAVDAACRHVKHCLAPRRLSHASRAYWKLAAVDSALEVCRTAAHAASRSDALPHALDLSLLSGAGSVEYLVTAAAAAQFDWRVTALDTDRARDFAISSPLGDLTAGSDPRVRLQPIPSDTATLSPLEVCTAGSAAELAAAVPGCWLVVGDLGSLRRLQSDPWVGVLEGELAPSYRRALLWEAATALGCLAPGGCAVMRLGACLTMFSAGVLYLLHRCFAQVAVVKPFASCACSSERLVVATGCLDDVAAARERLLEALREVECVEATPAEGGVPPAAVLPEVVPAGVMMRDTAFLRYMERRTTALARLEAVHCDAARVAAQAGEPAPSAEDLEALAQQAESVLAGAEPPPSGTAPGVGVSGGGSEDDLRHKYGGMFTRGGSDSAGAAGVGSGASGHLRPPQHRHQQQSGWAGPVMAKREPIDDGGDVKWAGGCGAAGGQGAGGDGGPPVQLVFRLLSRNDRGDDEFVCSVRCELLAGVAARTKLASSTESVVATRYSYRDEFEPQRHFPAGRPLHPHSDADTARMARLMAFLANTRRPGGREKVALLTPVQPSSTGNGASRGEGGGAARVCVSLQRREALDPQQDGLVLWC